VIDAYAYIAAVTELLGPATVKQMVDNIDFMVSCIGTDHVRIGSDFNHGGGVEKASRKRLVNRSRISGTGFLLAIFSD
jgi:microsomal dipeptidase-like Zn-dependent dipeptidase